MGGKKEKGKKKAKVIVVMPAYNAARTIERAFREIPPGAADEVLLVDDASADNTAQIARDLGITVFVQPANKGYGASQKLCYSEALKRNADIIVMLHADAQYDASVIPEMVSLLSSGKADVVLGSRMKIPGDARRGGMPWIKIFVNRALTKFQNRIFKTDLTDMHTGYRAYTAECLKKIPFDRQSDDFIFDSQFLAVAAALNLRMAEVPVASRYFPEASSIGFINGAKYTAGTLIIVFQYMSVALQFRAARKAKKADNLK